MIINEKLNEDIKMNEITINGEVYIKKHHNASDYSIVRTYSAGVFFGIIESRDGKEVVIRNARRIWSWEGAASLSQLASTGTSRPNECKFPCAVDKIIVLEAIEILPMTEQSFACLSTVPVWSK